MKTDNKLIKYHLRNNNNLSNEFKKEIEKIKLSNRRLSNKDKEKLLRRARELVYK